MVFIRQLAVFEGHRFALGKKGDLNRVFTGSIHCGGSGSLRFFFRHVKPQVSKFQGFRVSRLLAQGFTLKP
jgi:hypothetical protein